MATNSGAAPNAPPLESKGQELKRANDRSQARPHSPNVVVGALTGADHVAIAEAHEPRAVRGAGVGSGGRPIEAGDRRPKHGLVDARPEPPPQPPWVGSTIPASSPIAGSRQSQCPAKHPLVVLPSLLVPSFSVP